MVASPRESARGGRYANGCEAEVVRGGLRPRRRPSSLLAALIKHVIVKVRDF